MRVYHKPFVTWIWGGCLLMALGGFLALSDRRYRVAVRREAGVAGGAAARALGADPMSKKLLIPLGVFVVLVRASCWSGCGAIRARCPSPLIGKPAPAFALAQLHEPAKTLGPADLKGQVWLLNVWASWCVSCREEHPLLVELGKAKVVPIVGLNYKDEPPPASAGSRRTATRTTCRSSTATGASASTGASTACPRRS